MKYKYNSWPLGKVPKEFQRPEIYQLKEMGYQFDDARDVVDIFENKVAEFTGATYAAAVDCCSHGIFLALKYIQNNKELSLYSRITIPKQTYVSIPMQIFHAHYYPLYEDCKWSGVYQLKGTRIWDGAVRWKKDMYVGDNAIQVLSFQFKKTIPIGRGGMVITDDYDVYKFVKLMSYDGRDLTTQYDKPGHIKSLGYHYYMTPEDAARGIILMDHIKTEGDSADYTNYPDVSEMLRGI